MTLVKVIHMSTTSVKVSYIIVNIFSILRVIFYKQKHLNEFTLFWEMKNSFVA